MLHRTNITGASTLARYGNASGDQNKSIIVFDRTAQAVVNVSADTTFILKTSTNTANTYTSAITAFSITQSRPCNVTVNVEDGANFIHACMANVTSHSFHNVGTYASKVTVNGNYNEIKVANDTAIVYNDGTKWVEVADATKFADSVGKAAAGSKMFVLKDVTGTTGINIAKDLKIFGLHNSYKATLDDSTTYSFIVTENANVEVIDFSAMISNGGGFVPQNTSDIVLKRVSLETTGESCFELDGDGTSLTLDSSSADITANADISKTGCVINASGKTTLTLKNGSYLRKNNKPATAWPDNANFVIYSSNVNSQATVNVENGSKIILNSASGGTTGGGFAKYTASKTFTMNVDETSILLNTSAGAKNVYPIFKTDSSNPSTCVDTLNIAPGSIVYVTGALSTDAGDALNNYNYFPWTPNKVDRYAGGYAYVFAINGTVSYNGTNYTKMADAITAATAEGVTDATITLNSCFATTETGFAIPAGKNVTIDLNGYTASFLGAGYVTNAIGGNFTIKNGDMFVTKGIQVGNGGHFTLDGVNATVVANAAESRPISKITGGTTGTVTFKDSKVVVSNLARASEGFVLVENNGTVGTVNVVNSILEMRNAGNSNTQNNAFVGVGQGSNTCSVNVVVDGKSTLTMAKPSGSASVIGDATTGSISLTLKKGATVNFNVAAGTAVLLNHATKNGTTTIVDEGANYVFTAAAAKKLTALPTVAPAAGSTLVGFAATDGKIYKNGAAYTGTNDITFTTVSYTSNDFDMEDGAALRTADKELGIRFSSYVSDSFKAMLGGNAVYGTVVGNGTTDPTANANKVTKQATKWDTDRVDRTGKDMFYLAILAPESETITEKQFFTLSMSARAYFTVTYADGTTETFYSAFDGENSRTMQKVAENLESEGKGNNVTVYIIEKCA